MRLRAGEGVVGEAWGGYGGCGRGLGDMRQCLALVINLVG